MPHRIVAALVVAVLAVSIIAVGRASGAGGVVDAGRVVSVEPRPDGAYDVRFRSTGMDGDAITQTAVLWLPEGRRSGDVVAWGHPTAGLADHCAPSIIGNVEPPGLAELLAAGTTVIAPDYEGYGGRGVHPYLVGRSEGRSMLDALRAARSVSGGTGRSAAYGWSQGGHAAIFAARLAPTYAPDVRLAGVAAIAPVTDPASLVQGPSMLANQPGVVAMVTAGYVASYPDLDAADLLAEPKRQLKAARNTCDAAAQLADTTTWYPTAAWREKFADNDVAAGGRLRVPLLIAQSEIDGITPAEETVRSYRRLCARGSSVQLEHWDASTHFSVVEESAARLVSWLGGRLAGDATVRGCEERTVS